MRSRLLGFLKYVRGLLRFLLIITNNLYCIPTHVIWLTLLMPVRRYAPEVFYRIEGYLFSWLLAMVSMWSWSAGYDIVEQGDDISRCLNRRTLVVVNHQSTADVPILMAAFNAKPGVFNHIMWIMDRMFKYTNFGVVSSLHRDFFIASGKARRDESVRRLESHLKGAYIPLKRHWMVLFPEGGFLRKRLPISQRFAEKNNLPVMKNVTLPRMGALFVIRDTLMAGGVGRPRRSASGQEDAETISNNNNNNNNNNCSDTTSGGASPLLLKETEIEDNNHCKLNGHNNCAEQQLLKEERSKDDCHKNGKVIAGGGEQVNSLAATTLIEEKKEADDDNDLEFILDVTIGYPDGKPLDLLNIIHGLREPCSTVIYYRVFSTREIPRDDDARLSTWMYDRFIEKETLLEYFYKHKTFLREVKPEEEDQRPLKMNGRGESNGQLRGGGDGVSVKETAGEGERGAHRGRYGGGLSSVLVQQDLLRFIILHLFFITSTYFHYRILATFVQNCISLYSFS